MLSVFFFCHSEARDARPCIFQNVASGLQLWPSIRALAPNRAKAHVLHLCCAAPAESALAQQVYDRSPPLDSLETIQSCLAGVWPPNLVRSCPLLLVLCPSPVTPISSCQHVSFSSSLALTCIRTLKGDINPVCFYSWRG